MKKIKNTVIALVAMVGLSSCHGNGINKDVNWELKRDGGVTTRIELPRGYKLAGAYPYYSKSGGDEMLYMVEPMDSSYTPQTRTVMDVYSRDKYIFIESK